MREAIDGVVDEIALSVHLVRPSRTMGAVARPNLSLASPDAELQ